MSAEEVAQVTEEDAAAWSQLEQQKTDEQAAREAQEAMAEAARAAAFAAFDDATAAVDSAINDKIAADLQASLEGREKFAAQKQLQMGARRRSCLLRGRPSSHRRGAPDRVLAERVQNQQPPAQPGIVKAITVHKNAYPTAAAVRASLRVVPLPLADAQRPCLQAGGVR